MLDVDPEDSFESSWLVGASGASGKSCDVVLNIGPRIVIKIAMMIPAIMIRVFPMLFL